MRQRFTCPRVPALIRALLLVAALLTGALVTAIPAQAQATDPIQQRQRFHANSGDRCVYGETQGVLAWRVTRPPVPAPVDVQGVVTDRPAIDDVRACLDDLYYSVATFAGYAGDRLLDRQTYRADNSHQEFNLTLGEISTSLAQIDRVVVQVCRYPLRAAPAPVFYCGPAQTYYPIRIGPA